MNAPVKQIISVGENTYLQVATMPQMKVSDIFADDDIVNIELIDENCNTVYCTMQTEKEEQETYRFCEYVMGGVPDRIYWFDQVKENKILEIEDVDGELTTVPMQLTAEQLEQVNKMLKEQTECEKEYD